MPRLIFHPDVVFGIKPSYDWQEENTKGLG